MSTAKDATYGYKMVQTPPMIASSEAAAADAPAGGCGGAKAVRLTRAAAQVGCSRSREDINRRWATEAAGRRREGAGPASQPPWAG